MHMVIIFITLSLYHFISISLDSSLVSYPSVICASAVFNISDQYDISQRNLQAGT